jgi:hypothetical protein
LEDQLDAYASSMYSISKHIFTSTVIVEVVITDDVHDHAINYHCKIVHNKTK